MIRSTSIIFLILLIAGGACNAADICKADESGVKFSREIRIIPYKRIFINEEWSSDESEYESRRRFPIIGMTGRSSSGESEGLNVAAFAADYFSAHLIPTGQGPVFRLDGMMWTNPAVGEDYTNAYVKKYSAPEVNYYISFEGNPKCSENSDLSVSVKKGDQMVEKILFHVKDMTGAKDFWPEEREEIEKNP